MRAPVAYENPRRRSMRPCPAPAAQPVSAPPFTQVVKDTAAYEMTRALASTIGPLETDQALARLLTPYLAAQEQEVFVVVGLDLRNELRTFTEVHRGSRDRCYVEPSDVLRAALVDGCVGFVVAHNHPSGDARVSREDRTLTAVLAGAARPFATSGEGAPGSGLVMLDHLVIGGSGTYYSFRRGRQGRI